MAGFLSGSALAAGLVLPALAGPASAPTGSPSAARPAHPGGRPVVTPVPFGPGERMDYKVDVGFLGGRGEATLEAVDLALLRGRPAYHLRFRVEGGVLFAKVRDLMESWLDAERLVSLQYAEKKKEVNYEKEQVLAFFPSERQWVRLDGAGRGELPTDEPLDDVSFLYFVRTLPLEVGQTYEFNRYYKQSGNPVVLKVLRKERVTVPYGTFDTIVVQPVIRTSGLFGEGGEAEVYFTDDERRIPVLVRSKMKLIGTLDLKLSDYRAGRPVTEPSASRD